LESAKAESKDAAFLKQDGGRVQQSRLGSGERGRMSKQEEEITSSEVGFNQNKRET
jgi:hypothetical protein